MFRRSAFFVGGSPVAPLKSQTNDSCSCRCCCLCGSQSHQLQIKPTGTYPYLYLAKQQPLPLRFHPEKTGPVSKVRLRFDFQVKTNGFSDYWTEQGVSEASEDFS